MDADKANYKHAEITEKIIGLAMKVHRKLGLGFPEKVYQRSLEIELKAAGMAVESEKSQPIYYEGNWVGTRRLDLLIDNIVLVETKAISETKPADYNQIQNYLKAFNIEIGLLINFGCPSLQFKRFVNKEFKALQ